MQPPLVLLEMADMLQFYFLLAACIAAAAATEAALEPRVDRATRREILLARPGLFITRRARSRAA